MEKNNIKEYNKQYYIKNRERLISKAMEKYNNTKFRKSTNIKVFFIKHSLEF